MIGRMTERMPQRGRRSDHDHRDDGQDAQRRVQVKRHCHFKTCPLCGAQWRTRRAFLRDPQNSLNGIQAALGGVSMAEYAVFTHLKAGCGTSMLIPLCESGAILGCPAAGDGPGVGHATASAGSSAAHNTMANGSRMMSNAITAS